MRIAVVGAGIAGLRTAQLLERTGCEIVVFEGRDRIGGRMWTAKVGDHPFEAGAEWIDKEHTRTLSLLQELGLPPIPVDQSGRRYYFGGRWIDRPTVEIDASQGATLSDALDRSTRDGRTRAYLEAVALSDEGTDSNQIDLAEWRRFNANYAEREGDETAMSAFRFPGATRVCEVVATSLRGDVCLNAELVALEEIGGVRLKFADGQAEEFDEVVLTLPPTCLDGLGWDGARPWRGLDMTPTGKLALLFEDPFWKDQGNVVCDLPAQQIWDDNNALVCYVNGKGMEAMWATSDPVGAALDSVSDLWPLARASFLAGRAVDWRSDVFSGGGFPFVPPGKKRSSPSAKGPVRFAGDWTANWMGFVEGALESAERVVQEIRNDHGLS